MNFKVLVIFATVFHLSGSTVVLKRFALSQKFKINVLRPGWQCHVLIYMHAGSLICIGKFLWKLI
jgi:hypothetical protein